MPARVPSDADKAAVWKAYQDGRPTRVPLRWNVNTRVVVLDPDCNPEKFEYADIFRDPQAQLILATRLKLHAASVLSRVSDTPAALPDVFEVGVDNQNVYDAAYFGAPVAFHAGQVPDTAICYTMDDLERFLAMDFSQPLQNPWLRERLRFHAEVVRAAQGFQCEGRPVRVVPLTLGFDGPLTVAMNLFGGNILLLLASEPERAVRLFDFLVRESLRRNLALREYAGLPAQADWGGLADDSIQMISTPMVEELLLPTYEAWFAGSSRTTPASRRRNMHLCGDATRHFPLLAARLGIQSFDTGFPVNHGALRTALGEAVEISGGPEVALLMQGSPEACHDRARAILQSGVTRGGRFILQEANNLPPCAPVANLAAVYAPCQEFGRYVR